MHLVLRFGLLGMALGLACTSHTNQKPQGVSPASAGQPPIAVPPERLISSEKIGLLTLGQAIPETAYVEKSKGFTYYHYWDLGYFTSRGLRLLHLDKLDLIVLTTPKHNVHHVLVGPDYKTAEGLGLNSTFSALKILSAI